MNRNSMIPVTRLAGMIGPVLFVAVFAIEGWLRPGYNPLSDYVSALSIGPRGWVQITNFIVSGFLLLVFARGIAAQFKDESAPQTGPVLLTIIATGILVSGPFVMDPANTPRAEMSIHGTVHGILGGIVFLLMPICCFVFNNHFGKDSKYQPMRWWTLAFAIVITTTDIVFTLATKIPAAHIAFSSWFGLMQRLVLVPFMLWLFLLAMALNGLEKK